MQCWYVGKQPRLGTISRWLGIVLLGALLSTHATAYAQSLGQAVTAIGTTVSDMGRAVAFYRDILEFEQEFDVEFLDPAYERFVGVFGARVRIVGMVLGPNRIELTQFITPRGRPVPPDSRSHDEWFQHLALIVTNMDQATARLRQHQVQLVSPAPQRFPDGRAFLYFQDPDGHPLELAEFPGETPVNPNKLFQRIDHTAIVVRDLPASLAFYQRLGFEVTARAEGFSPVQERLNNVFGLHLEIVGLRLPQGGIHVELLHYLTPPGGRPFPADTRPNDLVHRHMTITTTHLDTAFQVLRQGNVDLRSPEAITFPVGSYGTRRALAIADPTGHAIEILEVAR